MEPAGLVEAGHQEIDSQVAGFDGALLFPLKIFGQDFAQVLGFETFKKNFDEEGFRRHKTPSAEPQWYICLMVIILVVTEDVN